MTPAGTVKRVVHMKRITLTIVLAAAFGAEAERAFREGLTCPEAQRLALGIGHLSGARVTLPGAREVAALKSVGYGQDRACAVWLQEKWTAPYDEREAMVRFGAVMAALWDPAGRLAKRDGADPAAIVGELPTAHYPALGCIFVAPVQAGKAARMLQAEETVENEAANPQEGK